MSITVLPPDVNSSDVDFTPVGDQIRFGLRAIKNVGENTVKGILIARESLGRLTNFFEFCETVDTRLLNKRVLESLVKAGAMDGLGAHRAQMIAVADRAIERAQKLQRAKETGQHGLFGGGAGAKVAPPPEELPDAPEWSEHELLAAEYSVLGFYVSGHPLDKYAGRLQELKAVELSTIEGRRNNEDIVVAGIIVQTRPMRSRRGAKWAILTLQDRTGVIDALVFPEAFQKLDAILKTEHAASRQGARRRRRRGHAPHRFRRAPARTSRRPPRKPASRSRWPQRRSTTAKSIACKKLFATHPGRCRVEFDLISDDGSEATIETGSTVQPAKELVEAVRGICGPDSVTVVQ